MQTIPALRRNLRGSLLAAAIALVGVTPAAQAQTSNPWYAGFSLGNANTSDLGSDTSFSLTVGYRLGRVGEASIPLALEGHYHDFGKVKGTSLSALGLDLVAPYKVSMQTSVLARLGFAHLRTSGASSVTDNSVKVGLGLQYDLSHQTALRGEVELFRFDPQVNVVSLGVVWNL